MFLRRYRKHGGEKNLCLVAREGGGEPRMTLWARKAGVVVTEWVYVNSRLQESCILPKTAAR